VARRKYPVTAPPGIEPRSSNPQPKLYIYSNAGSVGALRDGIIQLSTLELLLGASTPSVATVCEGLGVLEVDTNMVQEEGWVSSGQKEAEEYGAFYRAIKGDQRAKQKCAITRTTETESLWFKPWTSERSFSLRKGDLFPTSNWPFWGHLLVLRFLLWSPPPLHVLLDRLFHLFLWSPLTAPKKVPILHHFLLTPSCTLVPLPMPFTWSTHSLDLHVAFFMTA
jgi:hypothetical protein